MVQYSRAVEFKHELSGIQDRSIIPIKSRTGAGRRRIELNPIASILILRSASKIATQGTAGSFLE
jgi:hypothetical protein